MTSSSHRPNPLDPKTESLLQSFQSSSRRNPAATPRPPSMSPHPMTPGNQIVPTSSNLPAAVTTPKHAEPSSAVKQQTPTSKAASKKVLRTPFFEGNSSDENTTESKPHESGIKRRRVAASKPGDVKTNQPAESVEKDEDSPLFVPQTAETQPKQAQKAPATTSPTKSTPKLIPQVSMPARQSAPKSNSVPLMEANNRQSVVLRLSTETKRVADDIAQKNAAFLHNFPAKSSSHIEAKLDEIATELLALHKQKVEAVKGEYIAQLQKEMSECQKMIGILQQKTPEL